MFSNELTRKKLKSQSGRGSKHIEVVHVKQEPPSEDDENYGGNRRMSRELRESRDETIHLSSSFSCSGSEEGEGDDFDLVDATTKVKRVGAETMLKKKLHDSEIKKSQRKFCCQKFCLHKLSAKELRDAREMFLRQKSQDRSYSL
jgi:hypothetical protein